MPSLKEGMDANSKEIKETVHEVKELVYDVKDAFRKDSLDKYMDHLAKYKAEIEEMKAQIKVEFEGHPDFEVRERGYLSEIENDIKKIEKDIELNKTEVANEYKIEHAVLTKRHVEQRIDLIGKKVSVEEGRFKSDIIEMKKIDKYNISSLKAFANAAKAYKIPIAIGASTLIIAGGIAVYMHAANLKAKPVSNTNAVGAIKGGTKKAAAKEDPYLVDKTDLYSKLQVDYLKKTFNKDVKPLCLNDVDMNGDIYDELLAYRKTYDNIPNITKCEIYTIEYEPFIESPTWSKTNSTPYATAYDENCKGNNDIPQTDYGFIVVLEFHSTEWDGGKGVTLRIDGKTHKILTEDDALMKDIHRANTVDYKDGNMVQVKNN